MARILVTGASGFLGRHLPAKLAGRGHEVHLIGRNLAAAEWPGALTNIQFHDGDLCADGVAEATIKKIKPTHLLHMAWFTEPGLFWHSTRNMDWVIASLRLFRAFAHEDGERFVGVGSCAEYDWNYHTLIPDVTPLNPLTTYGNAKARLYQLLSRASQDSGISFSWGRVFSPFGPWENPNRLLPQVIYGLLHGTPVALTEGLQIRDFVYTEDAATLFAHLMDSPSTGAVNIGSGTGMSIRVFLEIVLRDLGRPELLQFGRRPEGDDAMPRMVADVAKLRSEIYPGSLVGVEEGIARTIKWWRSRFA